MNIRNIGTVLGALAIMGLTAGTTTPAAVGEDTTQTTGPEHAVLAPEGSEASDVSASEVSPAGCAGQTDWAHKSGRFASVHGRTTCDVAVASVGVTTMVQQEGWFWWSTKETDRSSRTGSWTSRDAHPHWDCSGEGEENYRGVSVHWSNEPTGRYSATTVGAEKEFSC